MEEKNCITCKHQGKTHEEEPCKYCSRFHGIKWEPKEEENCTNCRYVGRSLWAWPCMKCIETIADYPSQWEPKEAENEEKKEEKGKEDKDFEWPCFEKLHESVREMGKGIMRGLENETDQKIRLRRRAEPTAFPEPIYEHIESEIPEKVKIKFTDGTSAIYTLHVDQPAPQLIECVRIIRKWNNGYKAPTRRRRRK